ncbi:MAG: tRNA adenosine(34) deaminase TadA [Lachnospiraceae bacterium]|nr:tRNA adenosine(34) deaminase TadA [Lachnospiraceae bacterium]MBP5564831.1 tRNA adenosine(34) deaminase TadA [Lachnospiraceae bacterium]
MECNYNHEKFMKAAMAQAKKGAEIGEVPIGCVIVRDGKIIARGYNKRKKDKNTLSHAELIAINKACKKTGDWRLEDCVLYVTLEPCQMCAGAIVQARIPLVVIGCKNEKAGCAGSIINLFNVDKFNHQVDTIEGVLEEECSFMLTDFFKGLRQRLKVERGEE